MSNSKIAAFSALMAFALSDQITRKDLAAVKDTPRGFVPEDMRRLQGMERARNISDSKKEKMLRVKGLMKFHYGENYLYALNQKTADRKARKKGWL